MRIALALFTLLTVGATLTRADPIRYEQIPGDASGYVFVDIERAFTTHVYREIDRGIPDAGSETNKLFGGQVASLLVYTLHQEGPATMVVVLHCDQNVRKKLETKAGGSKDAVRIKYGDQDIYYSSDSMATSALGLPGSVHRVSRPVPTVQTAKRSSLSFGLGDAGSKTFTDGPSYIAFVGQNLVVATTDIPAMAEALDVLAGRKPSLANQDPQGLKIDALPGTIIVAAGFGGQATINPNDLFNESTPSTQPAKSAEPSPGAFDLDLFGSLKGKARFAQLDIGENEQSFFAAASIMMTDADSAEQLKNLLIGVKALVTLSQANKGPLLDPLEIHSAGKNVALHWAWPTAKLAELGSLIRGDHDDSLPATMPAKE